MNQDVQYDSLGRMRYHPEYHGQHKKPWTNKEEQYLIEHYVSHGPEAVSLALERTINTVMDRACALRKAGRMPKRQPGDKSHRRARQE